jgi:hypothetical protein
MAAFVVPMHTDDLELVKPDRFCVRRVQDVEAAGAEIMTDIDGEHMAVSQYFCCLRRLKRYKRGGLPQ